jgi:acetoin utilization deacetylase AcuC-like enzyme
MVGFVTDPQMSQHDTGPGHPERPSRLWAIAEALRQAGLLTSPNPFASSRIDFGLDRTHRTPLVELEPARAEERWLMTCHPPRHIERIRQICAAGGGLVDQSDTPVSTESYEAAMRSLGCALAACDAVMRGDVRRAFAAIRPPGHHAEPNRAMGFCLFSNAAIVARYIQRAYGLERVAVVDFDVHHGNGTQACLEGDPSVLFISLHQDPRTLYPGTGFAWEIGTGPGRGFTLNIPMDPGSGDDAYCRVMDTRVVPELDEFRPQALVLSAGFDSHISDPLAQMRMTEEGFDLITRSLCALADQHAGGRVISLLEGGYDLRALGRSAVRHVVAMQ